MLNQAICSAPNRKCRNLTVERLFLPGAELGLTRELLLCAKHEDVADNEPVLFSRKHDAAGGVARSGVAKPG